MRDDDDAPAAERTDGTSTARRRGRRGPARPPAAVCGVPAPCLGDDGRLDAG